MDNIRLNFWKSFVSRIIKSNFNIETFFEPFDDCDIICNWKDDKNKRILNLQKADKEAEKKIQYCISKKGEMLDYNSLGITVKDVDKNIDMIYYIFELWFIKRMEIEKITVILDQLEK